MEPTRLFDPLTIRNLTIRNRAWVSPMCQYSSLDQSGRVFDWHRVHYGVLARGGAGLVMIEATGVTSEGRISPFCLGIWSDEFIADFAQIVDFAHSQGAKMGIQLAHAGRKGSAHPWMPNAPSGSVPIADGGWQTVAPSPMAFAGMDAPHELTVAEIDALVDAFVAAADRAVRAGFDVLEIHSAHGYLLHEFLSPLSNQRDDEYGGSLENRARLLRRIVTAVRETHPETVLFVRLSATDWVARGLEGADAVTVARWMHEDGVDLMDVSSGGNVADAVIPVRASYQVPFAETVKDESDILVAAVGMITSGQQAESIVTTGQADAVFVGRAALRDPHFALNWASELHARDVSVPDQLWRAYP